MRTRTKLDLVAWAEPQGIFDADRRDEFSVNIGITQLRGFVGGGPAEFSLVSAVTIDTASAAGKELVVTLRAKTAPVEVKVHYAVYSGFPVVRKWLTIRNQGPENVILSHLVVEALDARVGAPRIQRVSAHYGAEPREIFLTGRAEDCLITEENAITGEGIALLNEAPGWMKRTDLTRWGLGFAIGYNTDIFPFERRLAPNEAFTTAAADVAFYQNNAGFDDPHWVIPGYVSAVMQRLGPGFRSPWFGNTWEPFYLHYDEAAVRAVLPVAAGMGLDIYTLDTGWSSDYAGNVPDQKKFPRGLGDICAEMDRLGLGLGLWIPLAIVSPESQVYRQHPEWAMRDEAGAVKLYSFPGPKDVIMCLASPYRRVAADRITALISAYHPRYVKIDLATVFDAYGAAPGCHAKGHDHGNWAQSLEGTYEGIQFVTDEIRRRHPDVIIALTFELWGQKHIIDYGLLAAGDLDWMSNVDDRSPEAGGPIQARTLLYHRAMAIPAETMLVGNLRATTLPIEERFATAIGSAPVLLGDLRLLTPAQIAWYRTHLDWFKRLRREVPMNEGFFPLGAWRQPNAVQWDGFARLSRQGEGVLVLFRNDAAADSALVAIPAFPDGQYELRSILGGIPSRNASGGELQRGLDLPFSSTRVAIFEVRRKR